MSDIKGFYCCKKDSKQTLTEAVQDLVNRAQETQIAAFQQPRSHSQAVDQILGFQKLCAVQSICALVDATLRKGMLHALSVSQPTSVWTDALSAQTIAPSGSIPPRPPSRVLAG